VALPPAQQEVVARDGNTDEAPMEHRCASRLCRVSPSPEVMPHGTSAVAERHPLALHFVPRSSRMTRNLLRNSLALARFTPEGAAAAATATTLSARNLLRNLLALAWMTPEVAAAAATAKTRRIASVAASARGSRALSRVQALLPPPCSRAHSQPSEFQGQDRRDLRTSHGVRALVRATR